MKFFLNSDKLGSFYYISHIFLNRVYTSTQKKIRLVFPHFESNIFQSSTSIDVLIPAIDKDIFTLPLVIEGVRRNAYHKINNIFVVGNSDRIKNVCEDCNCNFVDEDTVLPIKKVHIDYKVNGKDRSGWIFQQLLKLYGDSICSADNFLVIDADTVLIRPTIFKTENKTTFFYSDEYNVTYFRCFEKIFGYKSRAIRSYVSHMMLFNRSVLNQLRQHIETIHDKNWYEAIFESMELNHMAAFSEYECYANYFSKKLPSSIKYCYWHNRKLCLSALEPLETLEHRYSQKCRSLSFHVYP